MDPEETNDSNNQDLTGIPIEHLIGGPLVAASKASLMLARATAEYITTIGFDKARGGTVRNVDFLFERPNQDATTGEVIIEEIHIQLPLLSIVPIPNMQIKTLDLEFSIEVKTQFHEKEADDLSEQGREQKTDWQRSENVLKIHGTPTTHRENTRESDKSARYYVQLHAEDRGIPEALARVLDMMAAAVAPRALPVRKKSDKDITDESRVASK